MIIAEPTKPISDQEASVEEVFDRLAEKSGG